MAGITALVAAALPFRAYERVRWRRVVRNVRVRDPIFIIGHWQSGHSLVQLLLACDPRFSTLRLKHAVQPGACLTMQPVLRWFLRGKLPQKRLVDKLPNHLEAPQGDDFPLGLLTPVSFYFAWYFPSHADEVFRETVMMDRATTSDLAHWQEQYVQVLQKVLLDSGRERIAVRNACNTARIRHLLTAFPDARFIYCHRDPYSVFAAALERWEAMTRAWSLEREPLAPDRLDELTLSWCEQLLQRYLADRTAIPAGRLAEVAYTSLRERPVETIRQVYSDFRLEGFEAAHPIMEAMLKDHPWELAGARPLTPAQRTAVRSRWEFAFREWGYPM